MNTVASPLPIVTVTITTGALNVYPSTLLGTLHKAVGWALLTDRYMSSFTDEQVEAKALGALRLVTGRVLAAVAVVGAVAMWFSLGHA